MASLLEIAEIVGVLLEMFPAFKLKLDKQGRKAMFKAYHLILSDLDAGCLQQVCVHLGSTQTFFPAAGEIRQAYFRLADRAAGIPTADEAWAEVKGMFKRGYSRYLYPRVQDFSHPRVFKALEGIGDWRALCDSTNDTADRARFLQAYEIHSQRDQELDRMLLAVRDVVKRLANEKRRPMLNRPKEEEAPF